MKAFTQILALIFTLGIGIGIGQSLSNISWATPYPMGVGGTHPVALATDVSGELPHASTSNDSADVHGLDSGAFVLGNLDAAAEFIQSGSLDPATLGSTAIGVWRNSGNAITFGTAFSGSPRVLGAGTTVAPGSRYWMHAMAITTTGFTLTTFGDASGANPTNMSWVALGS